MDPPLLIADRMPNNALDCDDEYYCFCWYKSVILVLTALAVLTDNSMLSINSILRQGRYRIVEHFGSAAPHNFYDAYDNLLGNKVVIHETVLAHSKVVTSTERNSANTAFAERIQTLKDIRHDGIVRVRDGFTEIDRQYLVTEPVEARPSRQEFLMQPVETISRLLLALEFIDKSIGISSIDDLTPAQIRRTADGNNRLLYFGTDAKKNVTSADDRKSMPFKPLECIWNGLDLASQKAISNGYDESALETLESDPDVRTAIYGLGASVYQILTDAVPADALERSIEILDGKPDPIVAPSSIDPLICPELSAFVLKCLMIRREDRFQTATEARIALVTVPASKVPVDLSNSIELDDMDLLEIPFEEPAAYSAVPQATQASVPATFELSTDEDFLISEPEIEVVPAKPALPVSEPQKIFSSVDDAPQSGAGSLRFGALAFAGLLVVGVVGWGIFSFATAEGRISDADVNQGAVVLKQPAPTASPAPVVEPTVTTEPVRSTFVPETSNGPVQSPDSPTARPAIADSKVAKRTETKTVQKPTVTPKKKVTVDDLINDN